MNWAADAKTETYMMQNWNYLKFSMKMTLIYKYYKLGFKILILRLPKIIKFNMVQACRVFARHKSLSPPSDKRR